MTKRKGKSSQPRCQAHFSFSGKDYIPNRHNHSTLTRESENIIWVRTKEFFTRMNEIDYFNKSYFEHARIKEIKGKYKET